MKIFFATWLTDESLGVSLTKNQAMPRLISYHFISQQKITHEQLQEYANTGMVKVTKTKRK